MLVRLLGVKTCRSNGASICRIPNPVQQGGKSLRSAPETYRTQPLEPKAARDSTKTYMESQISHVGHWVPRQCQWDGSTGARSVRHGVRPSLLSLPMRHDAMQTAGILGDSEGPWQVIGPYLVVRGDRACDHRCSRILYSEDGVPLGRSTKGRTPTEKPP